MSSPPDTERNYLTLPAPGIRHYLVSSIKPCEISLRGAAERGCFAAAPCVGRTASIPATAGERESVSPETHGQCLLRHHTKPSSTNQRARLIKFQGAGLTHQYPT